MIAFLLVASLLPLIAIISEPAQASPAEDNFNVTWGLVQGGIIHKVYEIEVQNLANESRKIEISSFFENLNFSTLELGNVKFYEWKNWKEIEVPVYDYVPHPNAPIYSENLDENGFPVVIGYEDQWFWEVINYESKIKNDWKPCKMQWFKEKGKGIIQDEITIPKFGSDPKYDDFNDVTTENGTKRFRIEFDVPIHLWEKGWGSVGVAGLEIENKRYHPEWGDGWQYKKKITIDCAKIEGENLDNFPILISWASDSDLAAHAQDDGDDIAFVNFAETWQLDHEIEFFDGDSGQLVAYVRIFPTLYDNENMSFWMFYGNPDASPQENPTGVWDDNYVMVQHMDDYTTSSILDSTSYNNDGTKKGADEPIENDGKIAKAQDFDGIDDSVDCGSAASINPNLITITAWFKTIDTKGGLITKDDGTNRQWGILIHSSYDGKISGIVWNSVGTYRQIFGDIGEDVNDGAWHRADLSYDNVTVRLYVDGSETANGGLTGPIQTTAEPVLIGDLGAALWELDSTIDEVRISNMVRSVGWIKTTFNNENDPANFYSVGAEQGTFPEKPEPSKPIENQPYFEWSTEAVDNYRLLVDNDSDFSSPCENRVLIENYYHIPAENSLENGVYYWKVVAQNEMGENASDVWSFVVGTLEIPKWEDWLYYKEIEIDCAKVENENFNNFPVLISWTSDSDLAAHVGVANGDDILFTDSGGTKLDHELEYFDNSTGKLVAHVRVPMLYDNEDVKIVIRYGNTTATNQENPTGVWDDNFVMVQHMKDITTSTIEDSTSYNNDGTKLAANEPIENDGKIWKAQDFDGDDDSVTITDTAGLRPTTFTISTWVRKNSEPTSYERILVKWKGSTPREGWILLFDTTTPSRKPYLAAYNTLGETTNTKSLNTVLPTGEWKRLDYTFNGNKITVYESGVNLGSVDFSGTFQASTNDLYIGREPGATSCAPMRVDEVRFSDIVRSSGWIKTTFNNQSDPSTFYSVGAEGWMGEEEVGVDENLYVAMSIAALAAGIGVIIWAFGINKKGEKTKTG